MNRVKCTKTGEWITLIKEIGSGGEGEIYTTNKPGLVAKIYKKITADTFPKLQLMVNNPPSNPTAHQNHFSLAWPTCILQDSMGKNVGFLLPYIEDTCSFFTIYHPGARKKKAPGVDWYYLHTAAMNIASVMQDIHAKNYIIGDINGKNILLKSNALITIIDTDSFQVTDPKANKVYRCPVGMEEYTPPEMQGKNFQNVNRNEVQDRFGLAVLIWQLLFNDYPFAGKWSGQGDPPSKGEKIRRGCWVYGSNSPNGPSDRTIPLDIIHPQLQQLFRRCFNDGHSNPNARPSATEWRDTLQEAIKELKPCSSSIFSRDKYCLKYYSSSYGRCYWCEAKNPKPLSSNLLGTSTVFSQTPFTNPTFPLPTSRTSPPNTKKPTPPLPTSRTSPPNTKKPTPPLPAIPTSPPNTKKPTPPLPSSKTPFYQKLVFGLVLFAVSIYASWQSQPHQNLVKQELVKQPPSQAQVNPKDTIVKYYNLAPINRKNALELMSDTWRNKQANNSNSRDWWNSVSKVEVYKMETRNKSDNNATVKAWLKYYMKTGEIACENLVLNLIFDRNKNQWLLNAAQNVVQDPSCSI